MTSEISLTLAIIVAALALFATEKLRVDLVALLVLLSVALFRLITPDHTRNLPVTEDWSGTLGATPPRWKSGSTCRYCSSTA